MMPSVNPNFSDDQLSQYWILKTQNFCCTKVGQLFWKRKCHSMLKLVNFWRKRKSLSKCSVTQVHTNLLNLHGHFISDFLSSNFSNTTELHWENREQPQIQGSGNIEKHWAPARLQPVPPWLSSVDPSPLNWDHHEEGNHQAYEDHQGEE